MVIKPGKHIVYQWTITVVLLLVAVIGLSLYFCSIGIGLWIMLTSFPLMALYGFSSMRTFIMDETGCTVCILWYYKHYRWDELQLKQYVTYKDVNRFASNSRCVRAVEFHPQNITIPKNRDAHTHSLMRYPLSLIFIYFPSNDIQSEWVYPIVYEADEEVFCKKMKEWGVEITETTRGPW